MHSLGYMCKIAHYPTVLSEKKRTFTSEFFVALLPQKNLELKCAFLLT